MSIVSMKAASVCHGGRPVIEATCRASGWNAVAGGWRTRRRGFEPVDDVGLACGARGGGRRAPRAERVGGGRKRLPASLSDQPLDPELPPAGGADDRGIRVPCE